MSKISCVVSCPADTYSGYGARSRDFVKGLIKQYPDWDIKILSQRWGNTRFGYLNDHNETDLHSRLIYNLTSKPKVWFQITVPNEFMPVGEFNVGVTAGIETTVCHTSWIEGCNRMDLVIGSSQHTVDVLKSTKYTVRSKTNNEVAGTIELSKPTEVLFEGLDTTKYFKVENGTEQFDLSSIKEQFCFLTMGHWMQGDIGQDRKNIGYTVKAFLETFKNKTNPPALILKTHHTNPSLTDQEKVIEKINRIRKTVKGSLPNVYLIHGDLTDEQINNLYNHPKVKAYVSLTKGEGFGRPLLEFSAIGKPVISSGWSGQLDFLNGEFTSLIPGTLENVHESAAVKDLILKESQWFKPDDMSVGRTFKETVKQYKKLIHLSRKQRRYVLDNFTVELMYKKLKEIIDNYLPEFPEQVEVKLPKLKLPKLKKITNE